MDAKTLIQILVHASLILLVASVGLQARWSDLSSVARRPAHLFRAIIAVNVIVPAVALAMVLILPMPPIVKAGILIMAVSPMAPFLPAKTLKAGTDVAYTVGLYVVLILLAVITVPATLALVSALVGREIDVPVGPIAQLVLTSVLLPMLAGIAIASVAPAFAKQAAKIILIIAVVALIPVVILLLVKMGSGLIGLIGDGTLAACIVTVTAGLAAGHLLGGPEAGHRSALAFAAAARHPGIAAVVIHANYQDQRAMLAVILFLLVSVIESSVYQAWAKRRAHPAEHDLARAAAE